MAVSKYCIVKFLREKTVDGKFVIDAVPKSWIAQKKNKNGVSYKSKFPSEYEGVLDDLVKNCTPPCDDWKMFPVEILNEAGDYDQANRRVERCLLQVEANEDLQKSTSTLSLRQHARKKQKAMKYDEKIKIVNTSDEESILESAKTIVIADYVTPEKKSLKRNSEDVGVAKNAKKPKKTKRSYYGRFDPSSDSENEMLPKSGTTEESTATIKECQKEKSPNNSNVDHGSPQRQDLTLDSSIDNDSNKTETGGENVSTKKSSSTSDNCEEDQIKVKNVTHGEVSPKKTIYNDEHTSDVETPSKNGCTGQKSNMNKSRQHSNTLNDQINRIGCQPQDSKGVSSIKDKSVNNGRSTKYASSNQKDYAYNSDLESLDLFEEKALESFPEGMQTLYTLIKRMVTLKLEEHTTKTQTDIKNMKRSFLTTVENNQSTLLRVIQVNHGPLQPDLGIVFPISTVEQFKNYDKVITTDEEKRKALISLIQNYCKGSRTFIEAIQKFMKDFIKKDVQQNYKGSSRAYKNCSKEDFSLTQAYKCIGDTIASSFKCSPTDVKSYISKWLSYASDREGGRKSRQDKAKDTENKTN